MTAFDIVPPERIAAGDCTDAYFDRTVETLEHAGQNPHVVAEVTASQFPRGNWHLFAGVEDVAHLFEGRAVDVDALREGQLFDGGPVMRIEGPYLEFCRLETALLGFLSHPTGMATRRAGVARLEFRQPARPPLAGGDARTVRTNRGTRRCLERRRRRAD